MAVLAIIHVTGCKTREYDTLRKDIRWEQNPPKGLIAHIAGTDKNGEMQVADIWETENDFNNFAKSRLGPAFQKLNLPEPKPEMYPIHNVNVFEQIEQFRMAGMSR